MPVNKNRFRNHAWNIPLKVYQAVQQFHEIWIEIHNEEKWCQRSPHFQQDPIEQPEKRVLFLWKKENGVWNAIPFLGIKGPLLSFQLINYPNRITLRSTPTRVPSDKNVFPGFSSSHLFGSTRLRTHVKPQAVGRGWFLFGHHLNATENNKTGWTERKDDSYQ